MGKDLYIQGIRQAAGVVPIIPDKRQVLLITTMGDRNAWTLPKGGREVHEASPEISALREAYEEAGIKGRITKELIRTKQFKNKHPDTPKQETIWYEMIVDEIELHWLEEDHRKRIMVDIDEAMRLVTRPFIIEALSKCSLSLEKL